MERLGRATDLQEPPHTKGTDEIKNSLKNILFKVVEQCFLIKRFLYHSMRCFKFYKLFLHKSSCIIHHTYCVQNCNQNISVWSKTWIVSVVRLKSKPHSTIENKWPGCSFKNRSECERFPRHMMDQPAAGALCPFPNGYLRIPSNTRRL